MTAVIDTVNHSYGVEDGRSWWKVRLIAIALTIGVAIIILASFALIIVGPQLAKSLAEIFGVGPAVEWTWRILEWPIAFALASFGIAMVYYFAPDVDQRWLWLVPGTILATLLWLSASLGFRYYVSNPTRRLVLRPCGDGSVRADTGMSSHHRPTRSRRRRSEHTQCWLTSVRI